MPRTSKREKERVAIIGTNGLPARYGGFETLTHHLTLNLGGQFDFTVYCSAMLKDAKLDRFNGARLVHLPFRANGYQSVVYDIVSIIHAWCTADKLLVLGSSGAMILPLRLLFRRKKIVLNIGGIDWGRSKWSYVTRKFLQLSEWLCVKCADVVVTDNKYIQTMYNERYGANSALIEYGGDHVMCPAITERARAKYPFLSKEYTLSVSRAQSDNNIHMVLGAFEDLPDRHVVVVSNWNTSDYGRELRAKYLGKFPNIWIVDAIYDQTELDMIRSNAALYVHSHSFCGTAPSLVEAMNLGLPIICYRTQTNEETTEGRSIYFESSAELAHVIQQLSRDSLAMLRGDLKGIADRRYRWSLVARKYAECLDGTYRQRDAAVAQGDGSDAVAEGLSSRKRSEERHVAWER